MSIVLANILGIQAAILSFLAMALVIKALRDF